MEAEIGRETLFPGARVPPTRVRVMLVRGRRVLDPMVLGMHFLGMRVFGRSAPGVPALGRLVPGNSQLPGSRLRRSGGAVLIAGAALLVVAAGSPAAAGTSSARAPASLAVIQPEPPGVAPSGGSAPAMAPLHPRQLLPADLLVVSATPLPAQATAKIRRLHGVRAAEQVEAARVRVGRAHV